MSSAKKNLQEEKFRVDLGGIVELLSRNLYSGTDVYLRELLQNGVDAITASGLLTEGRIRFVVDEHVLRVTDNGVGLTLAEAQQLLATIGGSSKRDEFGLGRSDYLGQFGIGLLSCFMVSEDIVVYSRSSDRDSRVVRWQGNSHGTWTVQEVPDDMAPVELAPLPHGTTVELRSLPGEPPFDYRGVRDIIERYGEFLPVKITIERPNSQLEALGAVSAGHTTVWEASLEAQRKWCSENFGFEPFDVIPLEVPIAGFQGVAFVASEGAHPGRTTRHQLYLRRMLLSKKVTDLLPDWAYFVRVVGNTDYLRPTASRDALFEDSLLLETREALGNCIRTWLTTLAEKDPHRFARFIALHMTGLKALAVSDAETRSLVVRSVPFETTMGMKTLEDVMANGVIRFARTDQHYRALLPIASANDLQVLNAGYAFDEEILDQLRLDHPEQRIVEVTINDVVGALIPANPSEEARFLPLLHACHQALIGQGVEVILRDFKPATIPVLFLPQAAAAAGVIEDIARQAPGESNLEGILDMLADAAQFNDQNDTSVPDAPQLVINASSPLAHQLLAAVDSRLVVAALRGLYVQALLAGNHPMDPQARAWASEVYTSLISTAL
ncbi:Chaperone protein HtpG [Corynebacterium freiburgense]|nr:Chaperone protein HtpG [Corynebacterium freiburgense]